MRVIRWCLAIGGSFAALAVVRYACSHLEHFPDATSWAVASAASAAALTVLAWWASREPSPPPQSPNGSTATSIAIANERYSQATSGNTGVIFGHRTRLHYPVINVTTNGVGSDSLPSALPQPEPSPIVIGNVPQRPPAFQPRESILDLIHHKNSGPGIRVIHAVTGMRGVGKTQIAAAYARYCIDEKWRLVSWIGANTVATTIDGLTHTAVALGIPAGATQDDTARSLRHHLETHGQRCLLVFDNADDLDNLHWYLPATGDAHVIITTTSQLVSGLGTPIPIDVYTQAEALDYLSQRTGINDKSGAQELAAELANLPLALAQAAAVINSQRLDYPTYIARLRALPVGYYLTRASEDPYPHGAAAAILLALDAACGGDSTGFARALMNLIAWLSPTGVARELLHTAHTYGALTQPVNITATPQEEQPYAATAAEIDSVLAHLAGASLLTFSLDGSTLTAHRLITRVLREQTLYDGTLSSTVTTVISLLNIATQAAEPVWQYPRTAHDLIQHIAALHNHLQRLPDFPPLDITRSLLEAREWTLWCLNEFADNPAQAITVGLSLADDTASILGSDHSDTLISRSNLAAAYQDAGQLADAIQLFERVLCDTERILGSDHPDTLTLRNNLALAYRHAGSVDLSAPLFEKTLSDRERVLGSDHPDTLNSRNNLARAYQDAGRLGQAIPLFEKTLTDHERVLGPDHPSTLRSRNNLARAYMDAGRLGQAIPLFEKTLTDYERVLGPDHPSILSSRNNLACAYMDAGRLGQAIPLFEHTLTDYERVLGPDHPSTLSSRNNLARAYMDAGRLGQAIPLFEHTLTDYERVLGPDHPSTLSSRNNLGGAYQAAGRLDQAIPLLEQTLSDRERVLGPDHPSTLSSRNNLARAYMDAGRLGQAIPLLEQTLSDRERVLGPDHPHTLGSRNNLARAYQDAGRLDQAIPLLEQTLTDRERVLGPDHPHTLGSRNNLARAYQDAGRLDQAIPLLEQTLTDRERVLGPDHPHTLDSRNNLARAYQNAGRLDQAIPLFEKTLTDYERVLGPDHPNSLTMQRTLGALSKKPGSAPTRRGSRAVRHLGR